MVGDGGRWWGLVGVGNRGGKNLSDSLAIAGGIFTRGGRRSGRSRAGCLA